MLLYKNKFKVIKGITVGSKNMINIHYKKSCLKIKHNLDIKRTKGKIKLFMNYRYMSLRKKLKHILGGFILMQWNKVKRWHYKRQIEKKKYVDRREIPIHLHWKLLRGKKKMRKVIFLKVVLRILQNLYKFSDLGNTHNLEYENNLIHRTGKFQNIKE